jgi:mRNA-degrading endonuclease RelE of RelBE toxin-antitoxin system
LTTPGTAFRHHVVDRTPFVVVYEYDDTELRVLFIKHRHADRSDLDLRDVEW